MRATSDTPGRVPAPAGRAERREGADQARGRRLLVVVLLLGLAAMTVLLLLIVAGGDDSQEGSPTRSSSAWQEFPLNESSEATHPPAAARPVPEGAIRAERAEEGGQSILWLLAAVALLAIAGCLAFAPSAQASTHSPRTRHGTPA